MISSAFKRCLWSGSAVVFLFCEMSPRLVFSQEAANSNRNSDRMAVSADLETIYLKTESASTVADYTSILDFCRNVAGDRTRSREDREYARILMSWAANRRGEARSDQAGIMVRTQQLTEAEQLDALARKDFENAIQLDNTRWRAHHNLAITQAVQGETQAALDSFAQVIRLNPEYPNAYFNRGEILFRANQYEAALLDYEKGIQLAPDDSSAFSGRAHTLYALGKTKEALADYAKAMELAPQSVDAATEYADTCQALGNWKDAATAYQKAMQLDGKNARLLQNAAWMMATCPDDFYRNGSSALETAQLAVRVASAPASAQVLDVLAAAQATAGDFASAQSTVAEALRSTTDPVLRSELQMRGKLYQRKKVYVQPKR
ncbi:MAG: tetratricopeptide repeat protein [Pirellula sp.]|jgi:tetratricopeptide (TPR) repeat protein|nr:tetratricopeptide repeat protein [Pirellula sp.]